MSKSNFLDASSLRSGRLLARVRIIGMLSVLTAVPPMLGYALPQQAPPPQESVPPAKIKENKEIKEIKTMRLSDLTSAFMAAEAVPPLKVVIPASFERANLPDSYGSYWMPPDRVQAAAESGALPTDTGYFYAKLSPDVAYDAEKNIFVGFEDQDNTEEFKQLGIEDFQWKRMSFRGYPAVVSSFTHPTKKTGRYNMYIVTLSDSMVIHIAYTAPDGDAARGADTWNQFLAALGQEAR